MSDAFAALRERFVARCRDDGSVLEAALATPSLRTGEDFRRLIHRLSGGGGTFGFPALSRVAADAETMLLEGTGLDDDTLERLVDQIRALDAAAGAP